MAMFGHLFCFLSMLKLLIYYHFALVSVVPQMSVLHPEASKSRYKLLTVLFLFLFFLVVSFLFRVLRFLHRRRQDLDPDVRQRYFIAIYLYVFIPSCIALWVGNCSHTNVSVLMLIMMSTRGKLVCIHYQRRGYDPTYLSWSCVMPPHLHSMAIYCFVSDAQT